LDESYGMTENLGKLNKKNLTIKLGDLTTKRVTRCIPGFNGIFHYEYDTNM
jgi:hypothetical protein